MITLKTLKDATEQEVFDQVAEHLLTQNQQSLDISGCSGTCMYRNTAGLMCAVGCLIADDEYLEGWEGAGWVKLSEQIKKDREIDFEGAHESLLIALQGVHDNYDSDLWLTRLQHTAKDKGLNTEILKKYDQRTN